MQSMKNTDIVILSNIEWTMNWQRQQIFASYFSQIYRKVVFVESQGKRNPKLTDLPRIVDRLSRFLIKRGRRDLNDKEGSPANLTIISPLVLPSTLRFLRKINRLVFIPSLVKSIQKQGVLNPVVINYLPTQTSIDTMTLLQPGLTVYDCVENFPAYPGVPKDTAYIEEKILKSSDLVFTDSEFLYLKAKSMREDVERILPGVDYELFQRADTGPFKGSIRSLCFFGGINARRIDFDLLMNIANSGNFTIDMIGPVDSRIPSFPGNVVFHGPVPYAELPEYLKKTDAFIFPYRLTDFTRGIIPAKLFECFATGKPVIATPLPSFQLYSDLIHTGENTEELVEIIHNMRSLEKEGSYHKRKKAAQKSSWKSRLSDVIFHIEKKYQQKRIDSKRE